MLLKVSNPAHLVVRDVWPSAAVPFGQDPDGLVLDTVWFGSTETDPIRRSTPVTALAVSNPVMEVTKSRDNGRESPLICGLA